MRVFLARRLDRLEALSAEKQHSRWHAAVDRIRETMDPEHARLVADWLREHVDGKRHGGPCDGDLGHVCPRCIDRLDPPALARAVWLMLLDHTLSSGAPVAMPPGIAVIYLNDPQAYPANRCEGCGYLFPTQSTVRPDGSYRHIAGYFGPCPACGRDNSYQRAEGA